MYVFPQDLHAPTDIGYETIMNIEGESQMLVARQEYDPTNKGEQVSGKPTVHSSSVSFLSSWAPQEHKVPAVRRIIDFFVFEILSIQCKCLGKLTTVTGI